MAVEKASLEEKVVTLDRSMEHYSKQIKVLVEEKKVIEGQLEEERMRRKAM